ncbi:MAG: hypothetical protein ACREJI_08005, partial [Candidatus Methylomirabilales bacterium]
ASLAPAGWEPLREGRGDPPMSWNTFRDDVRAILWVGVPASLRLAVLVGCILAAYATGLVWAVAAGYNRDAGQAQARAELVEVRSHVRHLWNAYEAVRSRQDRTELEQRGWVAVRVADQEN